MKLTRPSVFSESDNVIAAFTEANRNPQDDSASINGIDFGINTLSSTAEIKKNYQKLLNHLAIDPNSIALANQVHGSNIEIVKKPGLYDETDGLITDTTGLALGIQVADCAAVLIADSENHVIGAFHAGWRGAVAGIIPAGLGKMISLGATIENLRAFISPCISQRMFEVGEEVAMQFPDEFVDRVNFNKSHVDLKAFVTNQLMNAGLSRRQIEINPGCTMQDEQYFSYRRERERAGRMLALITLKQM